MKRHNSRVEVVVVTELFSFFDGTFGEDADAPLTQDVPLLNLAVGVAAVVDEPVRVCTCEERARGDGKGDEWVSVCVCVCVCVRARA
jgi:hypothetical protein